MASQLTLIDEDKLDWRLDPRTREIGLQGVAAARAALRQAAVRVAERSGAATGPVFGERPVGDRAA